MDGSRQAARAGRILFRAEAPPRLLQASHGVRRLRHLRKKRNMTEPPVTNRNAILDLLRGVGLWILLIDHVQPDILSMLTPAQLGFSDFAELFIFVSGFINAAMYQRALASGGL